MRRYFNRIWFICFYILYGWRFKSLAFKSMLYPSVRAEGQKYISIADRSVIQRGGWLLALKLGDVSPDLQIGKNCAIGDYSHIVAVQSVVIEDNVLIANKVYISDNIHTFADVSKPVINQDVQFKKAVRIKEGAWLGENVCVIGASIGKNAVVGANSVVTSDIPDFSVAVGSPAKVIKKYDFETGIWVSVG